jgi:hypothetical protein
MSAEPISREVLDNALPYQVVVNLSDGDDDEGTLRRLFCANLNIGPGHETAVVNDVVKYLFCFANLSDANRFRGQFGGKLLLASCLRMVGLGSPLRKKVADKCDSPI